MAVATRDTTIETFLIHGGVPLSGTVRPAGNKNAALPILAACVLTALTVWAVAQWRASTRVPEVVAR